MKRSRYWILIFLEIALEPKYKQVSSKTYSVTMTLYFLSHLYIFFILQEEDDFHGFSSSDVNSAEKTLQRIIKQEQDDQNKKDQENETIEPRSKRTFRNTFDKIVDTDLVVDKTSSVRRQVLRSGIDKGLLGASSLQQIKLKRLSRNVESQKNGMVRGRASKKNQVTCLQGKVSSNARYFPTVKQILDRINNKIDG